MAMVELVVKGMSCMGCVKSVKGVLESIDGVTSVNVDLASGKTIIEYDKPIEIETFEKAIDQAGFDVLS